MKKLYFLILLPALCLLACKKDKAPENQGYTIFVKDQNGHAQPNAEVRIFASAAELIADSNATLIAQANGDGFLSLSGDVPQTIVCRAEKGTLSSEFIAPQYAVSGNTFTVVISEPSGEQLLCGHGSKKWLMTSYSINGSAQPYIVTSTLNSDGTWTDTNGNSGSWQFANNHTQLVYDYTSSGMTVIFDVLELTKNFISLKANQSGMVIEMEMTAV